MFEYKDDSLTTYKNRMYCIHNDGCYNFNYEYNTVVENCYLYNEVSPPIGAGLRNNQTQIYRNVESVCKGDLFNFGVNATGMYVHAPGVSTYGNCKLIIDSVTSIADNEVGYALALSDVPGSLSFTEIPTTIRRSIFITGAINKGVENFKSTHYLTKDSQLNNISELNY